MSILSRAFLNDRCELELFVRRSSVRQTPHHRILWLHGEPGAFLAVSNDHAVEIWDISTVKAHISNPEVERNDINRGVIVLTGHTMVGTMIEI